MRPSLVALVLLAACGARSGIDVPTPGDAGRPDAHVFDTFPCRWSYMGEPGTIGRLGGGSEGASMRATIHPVLDRGVAIVTGDRGGAFVFALTNPPTPVRARGPSGVPAVGAIGSERGWSIYRSLDACTLEVWDAERDVVLASEVVAPGGCAMDALGDEVALVMPLVRGGYGISVLEPERPETLRPIRGGERAVRVEPRVARATDGTIWVGVLEDRARRVIALGADGEIASAEIAGSGAIAPALAPDRLRGGVVARTLDDGGQSQLHRVWLEGGVALVDRLGSGLGVRPSHDLVTNETEGLFGAGDGTVPVVPLSGSAPRTLPPPEPGATSVTVALRDGTSQGAIVYLIGAPPATEIRARLLVCNR